MQLYCLLKEKAHIEKQVGILKGFPNKEDSVVSGGTGNCQEEEAESSFVTSSSFSSNDTSSYDGDTNSFEGSNSKQKAVAKRHCPPQGMILENSNDEEDEESFSAMKHLQKGLRKLKSDSQEQAPDQYCVVDSLEDAALKFHFDAHLDKADQHDTLLRSGLPVDTMLCFEDGTGQT